MSNSPWITIARIVRPQGRHGEVLAEILTDFPERFALRKRLYLLPSGVSSLPQPAPSPREIQLESHRMHQGRVALKFAGVDSISEAETLRDLDVVVPFEERAPLSDDSVYVSDLIGCAVIDINVSETQLGVITDVDRETTNLPLLVVDRGMPSPVLIPFAKAYVEAIDLAARRIRMRLPAGLTDLNS